jgi:hypothetical protein
METKEAVEVQLHSFLNWTLQGGERLASGPARFTPSLKEHRHIG